MSALVAACGGGGVSPTPSVRTGLGKAVFTITVPPQVNAGTKRVPHYVSPATQSMSISVNGGAASVTNLAADSSQCSQSNGSLTCTVTVTAPIATDTFDVKLYSGQNATGNVLAHTSVVEKIGQNTPINIVMNGVAATVQITVNNASPTVGSAVQIPVNVTVMDSAGDVISGPGNYDTPIALTDSDASGHTHLSTTSVTGPSTVVTLNYDGSPSVSTITISAQTGGGIASVTPATVRPVNTQNNGGGGVGVVTIGGNVYAEVPSSIGIMQVPLTASGALRTTPPSSTPAPTSSPAAGVQVLPISGGVDACTNGPSGATYFMYCVNESTADINVVNVAGGTPVFANKFTTDANPAYLSSFSGANCAICGIAFDSKDSAIIASIAAPTSSDYNPGQFEFYALNGNSQVRPTIPVFSIAENFGYNSATNQIWNSGYDDWELIDVASGNVFQSQFMATMQSPAAGIVNYVDAAAVDVSTNLLVSVDEGNYNGDGVDLSFEPLQGATFNSPTPAPTFAPAGVATSSPTPQPTSVPEGSFISTAPSTFSLPTGPSCLADAMTVDSQQHVAFLSGEFSSPDCVAVVQLPAASPASPFTPSSYMAIASMPNTPDGNSFQSADDPHVAATFYSPRGNDLYGLIYNYDRSWVAVIDITKLFAAPNTQSPHFVDPAYDLIASGVVTYLPTGMSPGPTSGAYARVKARRLHRLQHRR